jgi:hypothetical protein
MSNFIEGIPPLVRSPLRFGLIGGVLGSAFVIVLFYVGTHPFLVPVFMDFRLILFIVLIIYSLKELRDYYYKGLLYFWQGMIASLILTATFAIVASGLLWLFGELVPDFVTSYVDKAIAQVRAMPPEVIEKIGKERFDLSLAALPSTTAFDLALLYFLQSFGISFFISIIISVILRRQPQIQ